MTRFHKIVIGCLSLFFIFTGVVVAEGVDYVMLSPIPNLTLPNNPEATNTSTFIPALFKMVIGLATGLAVIMLLYGGIQYMTTDAWGPKQTAKETIKNALVGLLLTIFSYLIVYTINPKMLEFDLKMEKFTPRENQNAAGNAATEGTGTSGTGNGVGCPGDCPYSHTNSAGNVVKYKECSSCSKAQSFGFDIKQSIRIVDSKEAQINTDLGNSLKAIKAAKGSVGFTVTEAWPPTVNHAADQQYDGTSVDVSITGSGNADNVKNFMKNATDNNLRVVYEVSNTSRESSLMLSGIPRCSGAGAANCVLVVPRITGEHFSVYKK